MIVQAFVSHLKAEPTITSLVGGIYPQVIPQGKDAPAITYNLDDETVQRLLEGVGTYRSAIFDVNCWSKRYSDALAIGDAVEKALTDYRGQLGDTSPAIMADHIRLERRLPDDYESDTKLRRVSLQFFIGY